MGSVAIVSANYGFHDDYQPQVEQDIPVEWIMVTDDESAAPPSPWRVEVRSGDGLHPCLAAKRFRTEPWRYWPQYERVIWLDCNMQVTSTAFAREALACINGNGCATWAHPRRDCVYDEAQASVGTESQGGKYDAWPIMDQAAAYRAEGHPEHWGLYATGTLAWNARDERMHELGADWLAECMKWSIQDQISFPVVCRRHSVFPGVFPFRQITFGSMPMKNPWLTIWAHLK